MDLSDFLTPDRVAILNSTDKPSCLDEMCRLISRSTAIADANDFRRAILRREETLSTGIGLGLAVPHAKIDTVKNFVLAVGIQPRGLEFDSLDKKPVHIVVMVGTPADKQREYLRLLAEITSLLKEEAVRVRILEAPDVASVYKIFVAKRH